jgi:hypothetical protein
LDDREEILARVKNLRSQIDTSEGYVCIFDNIKIDSFSNFLIWDDEHLLLHSVSANTDLSTEMQMPFLIRSLHYGKIEYLSSLHSDSNGKDYTSM